ncbi:hypothetical protein DM47_2390 [Burkholderia mallei]|nr:hypothetical protein DM46_1944 [Burkholderia mallei]KOS81919.1 hypothetical protein DO61_4926 [Burkholderia mallei]KOS93101.1 hypothetical protein DM45_3093 [Burkholderia mallei]KOS96923.1 hypothetical protein DM49_3052 [Burkholderia mallei]KOT16351.1 hypothetical protein DM47_2390 [Burkholderia mallei]
MRTSAAPARCCAGAAAACAAALLHRDRVEVLPPERAHAIAGDVRPGDRRGGRIAEGNPQRLVVDDLLRGLVQLRALGLIGGFLCVGDQLVELRIAIAREVQARLHRVATELRREDVVRIAVVAGEAHEQQIVLAELRLLDQLAPFDHPHVRLHADLREVGLQQLRARLRVRVQHAARRAHPDRRREAVREARLREQLLRLRRIVRIRRDRFRVAPRVRRIRIRRGRRRVVEHDLQVRRAIEREIERLANLVVVERFLLRVERDERGHERGRLDDPQRAVGLRGRDVLRLRRQRDLAFARLHLLRAHRRIGRDRVDEALDLRLRPPVRRVRLVADHRVLRVTLQHERPGADRLRVQVRLLARLQQLIRVLGRVDRREAHREDRHERRVRFVQFELHGRLVDLRDRLHELREAHRLRMRKAARARDLVPRIRVVEHPAEREEDVVGVERARRLEGVGGLERDVRAQMERVREAVGAHIPFVRERGHHLFRRFVVRHERVEDDVGGCVRRDERVVLNDVEAVRARLGADRQRFRGGDGSGGDERGGGDVREAHEISHVA